MLRIGLSCCFWLWGACVLATQPLAADSSIAQCDQWIRTQPRPPAIRSCYQLAARRGGDWPTARQRLLDLLQRDPLNPALLLDFARLLDDQGDRETEAALRKAVAEFAARADPAGEAEGRSALASLLARTQRLTEASRELDAAAMQVAASDDPVSIAWVQAAQVRSALAQADYGRAWALVQQMEPGVGPNAPYLLRSEALTLLGSTLFYLARFREAREAFDRQVQLAQEHGDLYEQAGAGYRRLLADSRLDLDAAGLRAVTLETLGLAVRSGNRRIEGALRLGIGQDEQIPARTRIRELERALAIAREVADFTNECFALRQLAEARWRADPSHPEAAFRSAEEAIARARSIGDRFSEARGLVRRAQMRWETGPRELANAESLEALDGIERIRDLQPEDLVRAQVASDWAYFYYRFAGYLLDPARGPVTSRQLDSAFRVMERLRGRVLLERLDAARATGEALRGSALQSEREAVLAAIAERQRKLLNPRLTEPERQAQFAELQRLEAQEIALRDQLARADPMFRTLHKPEIPTLDQLRHNLAPDQAVLAFQYLPGDYYAELVCHLLVVTRWAARDIPLPSDPNLAQAIRLFPAVLERRDGSEREAAARLAQILLHRALAELPSAITRLVVIPDDALYGMPLEALPLSTSEPLVMRYEVTVVPSAAVWLRLREQPAAAAGASVLALADPWIARRAETSALLQPWREKLPLGSLPYSRLEARQAASAPGPGGRVVTGAAASERFLKRTDLGRFGVLHIAAHTVVDDQDPTRTAILVAPGSRHEDGLVQVREIVGFDLAGQIVVLSACRSSSGTLLQGEGVMSLARAFFQAGARAVVGSLWALRDDEAEALVAAFYRHLGAGRSVARALADAKRDRIRQGAPTAAWAGLEVMGDGDIAPLVSGRSRSLDGPTRTSGWIVLVLLVGAVLLWSRQRHPR